ncbi:MAG: hypothetical protein AAGB51_14260 [Planctomycetota bacterium]
MSEPNTPTADPISNRIARITAGNDPQFLHRFESGYAILANQQPPELRGGCMLLPDPVPASLEEMERDARTQFLADFAVLGEAVKHATGAERINYLVLCNQVPWLHAHAVPRFASEDETLRLKDPFEAYDFGAAPKADATGPDRELHASIRDAIRSLVG